MPFSIDAALLFDCFKHSLHYISEDYATTLVFYLCYLDVFSCFVFFFAFTVTLKTLVFIPFIKKSELKSYSCQFSPISLRTNRLVQWWHLITLKSSWMAVYSVCSLQTASCQTVHVGCCINFSSEEPAQKSYKDAPLYSYHLLCWNVLKIQ